MASAALSGESIIGDGRALWDCSFPAEKSGGKSRRVTDPGKVYLLIKCIIIYA